MELTAAATGALVVVALAAAFGALVVGALALVGQRKVRDAYQMFNMGRRDDVLTLLRRHIEQVEQLREDVAGQTRYGDELRQLIGGCVSRVGTVRYDAFDDMGGRLSFSVALLDEHGDGAVITAINGRAETRAYAKPVVRGESKHNLSHEEVAAIAKALEPQPVAAR